MADIRGFMTGVDSRIDSALSAGRQTEASPEEKKERINAMKTQGRKGAKMPRLNASFTQDNYDFLQAVSGPTGKTMSRVINDALDYYREHVPELEEMAQAIKEMQERVDKASGKAQNE